MVFSNSSEFVTYSIIGLFPLFSFNSTTLHIKLAGECCYIILCNFNVTSSSIYSVKGLQLIILQL